MRATNALRRPSRNLRPPRGSAYSLGVSSLKQSDFNDYDGYAGGQELLANEMLRVSSESHEQPA